MKTPTKCPSTIHTTPTIHDPRHVVARHRPHVVVAPEARRRGQRGWTPDARRNTLAAGDCPYLVGGIPTPLKNMSSSVGIIIPKIWNNKTCSKPPTSNLSLVLVHDLLYLFMSSCTCPKCLQNHND